MASGSNSSWSLNNSAITSNQVIVFDSVDFGVLDKTLLNIDRCESMEFATSAPFKMALTDIAILKTNATKAMEQSLVKRANKELI